jgi:putative glutamine amidotransferase
MKHGPAKKTEKVFHRVSIFEGTRLCGILGSCSTGDCEIRVRSAHHQGFKNPGRGLRLAAVSADGVFEALESRGKQFLIAVQWHPEKTLNDGATRKLIESFVRASRR